MKTKKVLFVATILVIATMVAPVIINGYIIINPQLLAPWLADHPIRFSIEDVSIVKETSEGVILEWHGIHFLVENTPDSHDLILQTVGFHQLYPDSMSLNPRELDAMGIGGSIPTKCFNIEGELEFTSDWKPSWQGGENLFFLNLPQPCYK
jgi:hypothetical protein